MKQPIHSMFGLLILFTISLLPVSCIDDNSSQFDAEADVYIKAKKIDGTVNYTKVCYIYGSKAINSAKVKLPDNSETNLEAYENNTFYFINTDELNTYSTVKPLEGTYTFTAVYNETEVYTAYDELEDEVLAIPVIDEASYKLTQQGIYISWDDVEDADAYKVMMYAPDGGLIFSASELASTTDKYLISYENSDTWYGDPIDGTSYKVTLTAIKLDQDATSSDWPYNIQCMSVAESQVVWKPTE